MVDPYLCNAADLILVQAHAIMAGFYYEAKDQKYEDLPLDEVKGLLDEFQALRHPDASIESGAVWLHKVADLLPFLWN